MSGDSELKPNEPVPNDARVTLIGGRRNESLSTLANAEGEATPIATDKEGRVIMSNPTGTQYTEGDVDATITGIATMAEGPANTLRPIQVDASDNVKVVEASAAAMASSLSVLDDWDETDRCKVNIIAGQVGVQGGAGAVTALTLRTTPATDSNHNVIGPAAHDAAVSGNPVVTGLRASEASPTEVNADGDASWAWGTRRGQPRVVLSQRAVMQNVSQQVSAAGDTQIMAPPNTGTYWKVYSICLSTTSTTAVTVILKSGATEKWRGVLAAPAGGGADNIALASSHPIITLAVNDDLKINLSNAIAVQVAISLSEDSTQL